jgi:hypothetical protein
MYEPSKDNGYQTNVCCNYNLAEYFKFVSWDCFAGTIIQNCVDYNVNPGTTCKKCAEGYYLDQTNNNCHPYTEFLDTGATY